MLLSKIAMAWGAFWYRHDGYRYVAGQTGSSCASQTDEADVTRMHILMQIQGYGHRTMVHSGMYEVAIDMS